jgi:hypothetical protein
MTEKQYEQFFQLLVQIVDEPGKTYKEKLQDLETAAEDNQVLSSLQELCSWFA